MDTNSNQLFREGFCEKAAELGVLPSELLAYSATKQAEGPGIVETYLKPLLGIGWKGSLLAGGLGLAAGGATGALANYLYNKSKFNLDPDDSMLSGYSPLDEAKKIHLLAKYKNGVKLIKQDLN